MCKTTNYIIPVILLTLMGSCTQQKTRTKMGTYGYDSDFLKTHAVEFLELASPDGQSKVLIAPGYQGRVMTTTAAGDTGDSYGWLNYKLIQSGELNPQFNPVGGEERFWLGPEGGPFSLYFKPGVEQVYSNWIVPPVIDTERYDIAHRDSQSVKFVKQTHLSNASGTPFDLRIEREISLLDANATAAVLGRPVPKQVKAVAYRTDNVITNTGNEVWTREKGLVSIWLLCMFNPTPSTTVFIPYVTDTKGKILNDDYFGKVPEDRLIAENGTVFFKIDGTYRSKIGLPTGRAKGICGSYDSQKKVLTILTCTMPEKEAPYVNSKWGHQKESEFYEGDVINSYNDGPVEDGSIMGPFYEIETSSPGAALSPGASMRHIQTIIHVQGEDADLDPILYDLFGLNLKKVSGIFTH